MTTTAEAAATALILAYLPHNPLIQYRGCPYHAAGYVNSDLLLREDYDANQHFKAPFEECKLWLRPFSALCTPLDDGTVPAVEVAKLLPWAHKFNWEEAKAELKRVSNTEFIEVTTPYVAILTMYDDDYGFEEMSLSTSLKVIDYLRRNHFAVGLKPSDYLPK